MGSLAGTLTAEPATSAEDVLAEMLAGVMKIERVSHNSHFFDDLGADSLVMAKFCARVRKREGLPVMSMKDIYANPTIKSLAEAFGIAEAEAEVDFDAIATLIQPRDPILARSAAPAPASTRQYLTCGALQLLFFLGYAW
jgi:acyl carrier protein